MTAAVTELQRKKENKKLKFGVDGGGIGGLVLLGGVVAAGALATIFTNHMRRKHGKPINRTTSQLDDRKEEQLNCSATAQNQDVQGLRSLLAPSQDQHHNCTVSSEETSKIISTLTDYNESEEPFSGEQTEICELVIASDNSKTVEFPNVDNYEAAISEVSAVDAGNLISSLVDPENIGNSHGGSSVAVEERSLAEFSEERIEGPSVIDNKVDDDKLVEDFVAETEAERNGNGGSIIAEENALEKIEEEEEKELGRCGSDSSSGNSVSNNGTEEEDSSVESNNEAVWPVDSIDGYCFSELTSQIKEDKPQILIQVEEHEENEEESIQKGFGDEETGDEKIDNEFVGEKKSEYNNVGDEGIDGYCCSELTTQVEEAKPQILIQEGELEEKEEQSIQVGYGDEETGDEKIVHREFIREKNGENSDMGDEGIDGYFCSELSYQVEETKPQILIQVEELEEKDQSIQMGSYGDETGKEKIVQMEFVGEKSENSDMGNEEIDEYCCSKLTPPVEETKPGILIHEEGLEEKEEESMQAGYGDDEAGKEKIAQMEFIGEKIETSDVREEIDGYCHTTLISQVEEINPHMSIEEGLEEKEEQSIRIGYGDEDTGNEKLVQMEFVENRKNSNVVDEETDGYCCSELLSQVEEVKPPILIEEVLEEKEQSVQLGCGVEESGNEKIVQMELVEEKNESDDVVDKEIDHHKELGDVVEEVSGEETGEHLEFQSGVEEKKQEEIQCEAAAAAAAAEEEEEMNGRSAAMGMGGEMMKMKKKKFTMMGDSSLDARLLVISILVGLLTLFLSHHIFRSYLHATTDG